MRRGLLDRVLAVSVAAAAFAAVLLAPSAGAGAVLPGGATPVPSAGWRIVPSPALVGGELMGVSALSATDAWAVGSTAVGGVYRPVAEHWDGSRWSDVSISGPGSFNELFSVSAVSPSDVWAVGVTDSWGGLMEHWNGSSWQVVQLPVSGGQTPLYAVRAFAADDVWAVGENGLHGLALHFDGSSWTSVSMPEPPGAELTVFKDVDGTSGTDVWAVGMSGPGGQMQPLAEHFDGAHWSIVPSRPVGGDTYIRGVGVQAGGNVWMVGGQSGPIVQHWDGTAWSTVGAPRGEPWAVAALSPSDAWIVGNQQNNTVYSAMIEHWNGSSWSLVPTIQSTAGTSELADVAALPNGMVWAVGGYSPQGFRQPLIELNPSG